MSTMDFMRKVQRWNWNYHSDQHAPSVTYQSWYSRHNPYGWYGGKRRLMAWFLLSTFDNRHLMNRGETLYFSALLSHWLYLDSLGPISLISYHRKIHKSVINRLNTFCLGQGDDWRSWLSFPSVTSCKACVFGAAASAILNSALGYELIFNLLCPC